MTYKPDTIVSRAAATIKSADDRMALIRRALAAGNPELADAIDQDRRCKDCGSFVDADGYAVASASDCCFYCSP